MPTDNRRRTSADAETTRSFEADLDQPREARRFTEDALDRLGAADLTDDAKLIVTELATNAVVHACCGFTVRLRVDGSCLHISVTDGSRRPPTRRSPTTQHSSGRGLVVVDALAEAWGTKWTATGKCVWVRLRRTCAPVQHYGRKSRSTTGTASRAGAL